MSKDRTTDTTSTTSKKTETTKQTETPTEPAAQKPGDLVSEETKEMLRNRSAEEQMKNDAVQWKAFLEAGHGKNEKLPEGSSSKEIYFAKQEVMKRLFALIYRVGLLRTSGEKNPDLHLNLASILSHGGRLVIQVPPLGKTKVKANALKEAVMGNEEERKGVIDSRPVASHTTKIVEDENKNKVVVEQLLKTTGTGGNYATLAGDALAGVHYSTNVGVTPYGAGPDNGQNGHFYMYYREPTKDNPGAFMVGLETCAAGKQNPYGATHGAGAVAGEFTSTGGTKFTSRSGKETAFDEYKDAGLVLREGEKNAKGKWEDRGLKIELTENDMSNINSLVDEKNVPGGSIVALLGENVKITDRPAAKAKKEVRFADENHTPTHPGENQTTSRLGIFGKRVSSSVLPKMTEETKKKSDIVEEKQPLTESNMKKPK